MGKWIEILRLFGPRLRKAWPRIRDAIDAWREAREAGDLEDEEAIDDATKAEFIKAAVDGGVDEDEAEAVVPLT